VSHLYIAFVGLHSRVACSHVAAATTNPPSMRSEGTHAGTPVDILLPKSHVHVVAREDEAFACAGTRGADHVTRATSQTYGVPRSFRPILATRSSRGKEGQLVRWYADNTSLHESTVQFCFSNLDSIPEWVSLDTRVSR